MNKLEQAARQALEALEEAYENGFLTGIAGLKTIDTLTTLREALAEQALQKLSDFHQYMEETEPKCNQHPDAPHGFDRNASHNAGRYVCECEHWSPDDMAYRPSGLSMEQAEQEPVAFIGQGLLPIVPEDLQKLRKHEPGTATLYDTPLYAAPLKAVVDVWNNVEQEPVAKYQGTDSEYNYHIVKLYEDLPEGALLYAAPVRTKDLTDDEIDEIGKSYFDEWSFGFARAVIAAYKEKNK